MASLSDLTEVIKRLDQQDKKIKQQADEITELKRQLWQLKQTNVQSLNGKSDRKNFVQKECSDEIKTWAEKLQNVQVGNHKDWTVLSDHSPVIVTFEE